MDEKLLRYMHSYCTSNKEKLLNVKKCGCFSCLKIFNSNEIKEWIKDKNGDTALCPYCMVDSIVPESNEYELNESLLKEMRDYWM